MINGDLTMITVINTLEQVLENIEPFNTKEDIIHEIKTMLREAENELNKQMLDMLKESLDNSTEEEKKEILEEIENLEQLITEG